jgi:hypothetical protein
LRKLVIRKKLETLSARMELFQDGSLLEDPIRFNSIALSGGWSCSFINARAECIMYDSRVHLHNIFRQSLGQKAYEQFAS